MTLKHFMNLEKDLDFVRFSQCRPGIEITLHLKVSMRRLGS